MSNIDLSWSSRALLTKASRSGGVISSNVPFIGYTTPSGARMWIRIAPPTRTSNSHTGLVKPFGPHHCATCLGSVQALNTSSLGASKTRVIIRSHSECSVGAPLSGELSCALTLALCADMFLLLRLVFRILFFQLQQVVVQTVEAVFPEAPVVVHPSGYVLQRVRLQAAGPPLRLAAASNQPGALQHFQ